MSSYSVAEDRGRERDLEWDAFVDAARGGHHAQTSLWAAVKATLGWEAARLIARRDAEIAGGVQLLVRGLGRAGAVAFAPRGPVLGSDDPELVAVLERAVMRLGRRHGIRYVKLQPPEGRDAAARALRARGWTPSAIEAAPVCSVRVRIDRPDDAILGAMRKSTRKGIRKAAEAGLQVRTGGEEDLPAFYRLVQATASRHGFDPYPERCYEAMWREFGAQGRATLMIGEVEGRPLAGTLALAWGDSAVAKMGGWCGDRQTIHPNSSIDYACMRWSRELGMRWFDFDGVPLAIARAVRAGDPLPEAARTGATVYKLGFGGEIVIFPGALDSSPHPILRPAVRLTAPRLTSFRSVAHRALGRGA